MHNSIFTAVHYAQTTCTPKPGEDFVDPSCIFDTEGGKLISAHGNTLGSSVIGSILDPILLIAGGLAVLALIYSGILYLTAYGDENRAKVAKQNATWAVIGIIVIVLSYVIVTYIGQGTFLTPQR